MNTFRVAIGVAVLTALQLACGDATPPGRPPEATQDEASSELPPARSELPLPPPVVAAAEPSVARQRPAEPEPEPEPEVAPQAAPQRALDLEGLERRLKQTKALGVLTKLALKNEIDDLIADVDAFHRKQRGDLAALRERFDLLLMKVMSLLQDKEPDLAREIAGAREGLWGLFADPSEFAKLST